MEENPNIETTKKENIFVRAKNWGVRMVDKGVGFIAKNPMLIMPLASLFVGCIGAVTGGGAKRYESCKVEDDVTGENLITKHPLTNDEILELGDRMNEGIPKGRALDDMGLLRKERKRK